MTYYSILSPLIEMTGLSFTLTLRAFDLSVEKTGVPSVFGFDKNDTFLPADILLNVIPVAILDDTDALDSLWIQLFELLTRNLLSVNNIGGVRFRCILGLDIMDPKEAVTG